MLEITFILAAIVILFIIVAARQPDDFCITRSVLINANTAAVFTQVNDLQKWEAWSPWAKLDPNAENYFEGPAAGAGAIMRWAGNRKIGVGSMKITESRPDDFIQFKLQFLKPFVATNAAEFYFTTEGDQTRVTWSMFGKNNLMAKVMGLLMNCDKMVGGQFEQGLGDLKAVVEAGGK